MPLEIFEPVWLPLVVVGGKMNTARPLVSVIMPVFNGGHLLKYSLESIRSQEYSNLEIILIDDGSTDGSRNMIDSFSSAWPGSLRALSHPNRRQRGIAASYRLGLQHCQGKYIAFLEQDDVWPADKLSKQIEVLEGFPEVGVVFSDVYICDEEGRVAIGAFKPLINRPPSERPFRAFWRLLWGNCVATFSNFMVRRNQINISDILTEPEGFQDWMLLLLLSSRCKFYHCRRTRTIWRQRPDSYHGRLKQLPTYVSMYRKLRMAALLNAMERILSEQPSFNPGQPFLRHFSKGYWRSVISVLSAAEYAADVLSRRFYRARRETQLYGLSLASAPDQHTIYG
jgi:glycosyltransferase involved in cell wall biosynthesis